jgi:LacI family transcriptional regulator
VTESLLTKPRPKRVTLTDVAAKAGVSVATASVAITGRPSGNCRVSAEVAERIRRTAADLNYRPNIQARNLSTQRTRTIAVLVKRAAWHNAMFYLSAVQRLLRQRGYSEMFMLHADDQLGTERGHLEACIERRVEGIIATPLIDLAGHANVELFNRVHREEGIPVVQLGLALAGCVAPAVVTDEAEGIGSVVRLLHVMGHRRIAHATVFGYDSAEPLNPFRPASLRYDGYRREASKLGLPEHILCSGRRCTDMLMVYDDAVALGRQIGAVDPSSRPTAVVAFSDYSGAGLIAGLTDAGVNVPGDVSVIAVGEQPFARMLRPALSTLAPPFERMGELATQTILSMIDGNEGVSVALPAAIVMRSSVREIA